MLPGGANGGISACFSPASRDDDDGLAAIDGSDDLIVASWLPGCFVVGGGDSLRGLHRFLFCLESDLDRLRLMDFDLDDLGDFCLDA